MNQLWQILAVVRDILLAPIRALLDPWKAMHGKIGGGLFQLSTAAIAALLVCLLFTIIAIAFGLTLLNSPQYDFKRWLAGGAGIFTLIMVLTVVVYYMVRAYTQEAGDRFPDIDYAWREGLNECRRHGFDLRKMPLYLVLGSERSSKDQNLMAASELNFAIANFPKQKDMPLRWYASEDAVFVVLSHVGCLSMLSRAAAQLVDKQRVQVPLHGPSERARVGVAATVWPTEDESSLEEESSIRRPGAPATQAVAAATMAQTIGAGNDSDIIAPSTEQKKPQVRLAPLESQDIDLERRRLAYVCRLAANSRKPFCAINGVMLQLPLNLILADQTNGALAKQAVLSDISTLVERFRLRFPVVTLITGWEEDLGFQEFTRRMPMDSLRRDRFGRGFGVGDPPLTDQLAALCMHASRQFEVFIYRLFREANALSRPGNRQLYGLLCKVRRYLYPRLDKIIAEGIGCEDEQSEMRVPMALGCYFAGAGPHEDTRAFVKGVFQKLIEADADLQWTPDAESTNARCYAFGYLSIALALLLLIGGIPLTWFFLHR